MDDSNIVTFKTNDGNTEDSSNDTEIYERDPFSASNQNSGDGDKIPNILEKHMRIISAQLSKSMETVKGQVQKCLSEFEDKLENLQEQIRSNRSENEDVHKNKLYNECGASESDNVTSPIKSNELRLGRGQRSSTPQNYNEIPCLQAVSDKRNDGMPNGSFNNSTVTHYSSLNHSSNKSATPGKLKPQTYNGSDDLDEYLTQFNIVSEINQWNYETKSLYLASCLVDGARALLNELDEKKRRDYHSLVDALNNRFGSINRAEVYRSKLQSRVRERNETVPELAQSIKKLTRKAYPSATPDVIDLLALDYFIDALTDTEIRLRLREVGPKTINEAERIAVRLEAHRIADKSSKTRQTVRTVESVQTNNTQGDKLDTLAKSISSLTNEVKDLKAKHNNSQNAAKVSNAYSYRPHDRNYNYNSRNTNQNVSRYHTEKGRSNYNQDNRNNGTQQRTQQNVRTENFQRSYSGTGMRQNSAGPAMFN